MVTLTHKTPPRLDAPAYAADGDGAMLHRYLDTEFMPKFLSDLKAWRLPGAIAQDWRQTDQFGKRANGLPTLRLPVHRAFYMVNVEASCDEAGRPALDPRRVASSGFVIRRGGPDNPQIWQIGANGPDGWRVPEHGADAEPDERRRLALAGLLRAPEARGARANPLVTGEETYPLRPMLVDQPGDGVRRGRKRTMLHGFLPLSGTAPVAVQANANAAVAPTVSGRLAEFAWPFGCWNGDPNASAPTCGVGHDTHQAISDCCEIFDWTQRDGTQIFDGVAEPAFEGLLRALVERWRVQEPGNPDNTELRQLLSQIQLRSSFSRPAIGAGGDASLAATRVEGALLDWISEQADALTVWFAVKEAAARGLSGDPGKLPGLSFHDLYITEAQALEIREAIVARGEADERALEATLPIPRFGQGDNDVFHVRTFLRYLDDCGCERLVWGPASAPFRVTSPLDPEAAAPVAIQLPELDDVKRGLAKGVTFLSPKSLMDAIDRVKPDMNFEEKAGGNRLAACLSFSLSFSIPAITICALLLLMIILQLLNFFFQWLPWVFLRFALKCR